MSIFYLDTNMTDRNYKPKLKNYNLLDLGMGIRVEAIKKTSGGMDVWILGGSDCALPITQAEIESMVFRGHYKILLSKNRLSKKDKKIIKISRILASADEFHKICEKLIKEIN